MASLVIVRGPNAGRQFALAESGAVIGREPDVAVTLPSPSVSRRHANIRLGEAGWLVEDLGSSNGTLLNGRTIHGPEAIAEGDELRIGPYALGFRLGIQAMDEETDLVVREQVEANPSDSSLHGDAARLLESVLTIGRELAGNLDLATLPDRLLDRLFALFPKADRGLVLACEGDSLVSRACRSRRPGEAAEFRFSRTVVRRALDAGAGLLIEDIRTDPRFEGVATITGLEVRSVMCVPLLGANSRRLGIVQLDCAGGGRLFSAADLRLLTAVAMHMSSALENATLHAELLREEALRADLAFARRVQHDYLPHDLPADPARGFELVARARPAREVSGDLCDFFPRPDGTLTLLVADVCGKGIPAALNMLAVRSLARHPAAASAGPTEALAQLNTALAADNRTGIFVTAVYAVYDPATGELTVAARGHSPPLLRHVDGSVDELALAGGVPLGLWPDPPGRPNHADTHLTLQPGEGVLLFTDGLTEAIGPDGLTRFGPDRLRTAFAEPAGASSATERADRIEAAIDTFTGHIEPADDRTFLLLQRSGSES